MSGRVLVTGANGCIGAWVIRQFLADGEEVVALDAGDDDHRLRMILHGVEQRGKLEKVRADIRDLDGLKRLVRDREVDRVIHLAALQVPFARANPPLGAAVNVVGTVNLFEAVKGTPAAERPLVYASSVAVYQPSGGGPRDGLPDTHYGVYKRANEGTAQVYARDDGIASIGFRPYSVYGVGRDQGVTASPTWAMLAAARGEPYTIAFSGAGHLQLAEDVAAACIAASRAGFEGATTLNLSGPCPDVTEIVAAIEAVVPDAQIAVDGRELPFPSRLDASAYAGVVGAPEPVTPLADGVARTIDHFRRLDAEGRLELP